MKRNIFPDTPYKHTRKMRAKYADECGAIVKWFIIICLAALAISYLMSQ